MITPEQLAALEQVLYDRAMDGDTRLGLALLKLRDRAVDPEQVGGVIILPMVEIDQDTTGGADEI